MTTEPLRPASSVGYQVNRLARLFEVALRNRIAAYGVVPGQFPALLALYERDRQTQRPVTRSSARSPKRRPVRPWPRRWRRMRRRRPHPRGARSRRDGRRTRYRADRLPRRPRPGGRDLAGAGPRSADPRHPVGQARRLRRPRPGCVPLPDASRTKAPHYVREHAARAVTSPRTTRALRSCGR